MRVFQLRPVIHVVFWLKIQDSIIMTSHPNPRDSDEHNTLPRKNVEWIEAIVRWTRYDYVAMYDYPTTENSDTVKEIFKGDTVQVSRRYRREDWCLCRVGHVLGWVFLKDVRFIVQGASAPRPQPMRRKARPEPIDKPKSQDATTRIPYLQPNPNEVETQPVYRKATPIPPVIDMHDKPLMPEVGSEESNKKSMIERLIKFFKK